MKKEKRPVINGAYVVLMDLDRIGNLRSKIYAQLALFAEHIGPFDLRGLRTSPALKLLDLIRILLSARRYDLVYVRYAGNVKTLLFGLAVRIVKHDVMLICELPTTGLLVESKLWPRSAFWRTFLCCVWKRILDCVVVVGDPNFIFCGIRTIPAINGASVGNVFKVSRPKRERMDAIAVCHAYSIHGLDRFLSAIEDVDRDQDSLRPLTITLTLYSARTEERKKLESRYSSLIASGHFFVRDYVNEEELKKSLIEYDIAIDSLARHREGDYCNSSLKAALYLSVGIPIITSSRHPKYDDSIFSYHVDQSDSNLDLRFIHKWLLTESASDRARYEFFETQFFWPKAFGSVLVYMREECQRQ